MRWPRHYSRSLLAAVLGLAGGTGCRRDWILLSLMLLGMLVARWIIASRFGLVTADGSNYLGTMHQVFDHEFTGLGMLRPPLIAVPLKAATLLLSPPRAVAAVGVIASVIIGIPFYLLATRVSAFPVALLTAGLFVSTPAYSAMLGWGYITLVGMFFSLLTFYLLLRALDGPSWRNVVQAGVLASLIAGFHQVSLFLFVLIVSTFCAIVLFLESRRLRRTLVVVIGVAVVAAVFAIPYAPAYLNQIEQMSAAAAPLRGDGGSAITLGTISSAAAQVYYPVHLWVLAAPFVLMGLVTMRSRDTLLYFLTVAAALVCVGVAAGGSQVLANRAMYFSVVPVWLLFAAGVGWVLQRVLMTSSACSKTGTGV